MKPTVFTNSELGKLTQKFWLQENMTILCQHYDEKADDFILVVPNEDKNAVTMFMNLKDNSIQDFEIRSKIHHYVTKNKSSERIVVIFMNLEGRVSYYTVHRVKKN